MFATTVDFLRLISSFPLLTDLTLDMVFATSSPCVSPPVKATRLRYVRIGWCMWRFWRVMLCWKWPHSADDPNVGAFPGLRHTDAAAVADMLEVIYLGLLGDPPRSW